MKQKSIISALTLIASLTGYTYAKHLQKDPVPIVMVSGFFGALMAEAVVHWFNDEDKNDRDNPPPQTT